MAGCYQFRWYTCPVAEPSFSSRPVFIHSLLCMLSPWSVHPRAYSELLSGPSSRSELEEQPQGHDFDVFHPRFGLLLFFHDFWMLLTVRFFSHFRTLHVCVFPMFFLAVPFPLRIGWEFVPFPFSVCVTFFNVALRSYALWICGCWVTANFSLSMLGVWLLPYLGLCKVAIICSVCCGC